MMKHSLFLIMYLLEMSNKLPMLIVLSQSAIAWVPTNSHPELVLFVADDGVGVVSGVRVVSAELGRGGGRGVNWGSLYSAGLLNTSGEGFCIPKTEFSHKLEQAVRRLIRR